MVYAGFYVIILMTAIVISWRHGSLREQTGKIVAHFTQPKPKYNGSLNFLKRTWQMPIA